jgi:hypothetical protein
MAELTTMRNNVLGYPIYGMPYVVAFPILDEDGDPVTGLTPDSEVSLNGDTGADTATEAAEIAFTTATNKGMYQLQLSAAEMTANVVTITVYTGATTSQATPIVLYPKQLPMIASGVAGATGDDTTHIHLDGKSAINDFYNGCIVFLKDHTGANQVRMITDYVGATCLATVAPAFATAPDNTTDYEVYLTDVALTTILVSGIGAGGIAAASFANDAITAASINTGAFTADAFAADAIIAATLATGAITADAFAADAIIAATLATGALTADAFAANAIIAATLAADCITNAKIADDAIAAENLATGTLTADAFAANAIVAATLNADCITAAKIANGAIDAATFAAGAIDAAAIAAGAIDNATFAADVGSTAYATNIIALAADKAVVNAALATAAELLKVPKSDSNVTWNATALAAMQAEANDALIANNLDHLALTATGAADMTTEVADNTILSRVLGNGDTSTFVPSTDGLHAAGVDLDAILADTNELQVDDYPTSIAAVKADTAAILTDTGTTLEADLDAIIAAVITNAAGVDIAADIIALKAETASILADTNELQVDDYPTSIAAVKADTAAILTDTGTTLDGRIPGALVGGKMDVASAIKKNTALAKFAFIMTDATTHAPKAGVTVTCTRSIDGAAFGAGTLANIAEQADAVGGYLVDFGAGDLNGKTIMLRATGAGCDDTFVTLVTEV